MGESLIGLTLQLAVMVLSCLQLLPNSRRNEGTCLHCWVAVGKANIQDMQHLNEAAFGTVVLMSS